MRTQKSPATARLATLANHNKTLKSCPSANISTWRFCQVNLFKV
ncbi:hypothetical protein HMPREF1572_01300 [Gardnerella vaginalis JCP7275]|nr:hypothetical protein HMPREF1572_01300 [Gardnerella vaginalis JCP7275]